MKKRWILLALLAAIAVYIATLPDLPESHDSPYINAQQTPLPTDAAGLIHRVILFGDAGESSLKPLQPSLALATKLAKQQPAKTTILAMGDNIYYRGFPVLDEGVLEFDEVQLEDISHLEAQLEVAKRSGARLILLPGNHDWYAGQTDDQARFISDYADRHNSRVELTPWKAGAAPLPELVNVPGVSLLLIDSQWMQHADGESLQLGLAQVQKLIAQVPPGNVLILSAHHPIETMGPHALYYTSRAYKVIIGLIGLVWGNDQDIDHPAYAAYIDGINTALKSFQGQVIYAAGHDHSLQVFGDASQPPPQYRLVSGAANTSKVSGVGDNDHTRFAQSREGFMAVDVRADGTWLRVWNIDNEKAVFSLQLFGPAND